MQKCPGHVHMDTYIYIITYTYIYICLFCHSTGHSLWHSSWHMNLQSIWHSRNIEYNVYIHLTYINYLIGLATGVGQSRAERAGKIAKRFGRRRDWQKKAGEEEGEQEEEEEEDEDLRRLAKITKTFRRRKTWKNHLLAKLWPEDQLVLNGPAHCCKA